MENNSIKYNSLEQNIIDVIVEQQLKLGYLRETVRLYYPLSSLNSFLETDTNIEEMIKHMQDFAMQARERLGKVTISNNGERFCIAIPPEGTEYIHAYGKKSSFLEDLIHTVNRHGCTLEGVLQQFYKYSNQVHVEKVENGEFDYLVYFEDGVPDSFRYCITVEKCHVIYHRYTIKDYEEFHF